MIRTCLCFLVDWGAFVAAAYGGLVAAYSLYKNVIALRAKRRASNAIQHALEADISFRELVGNADKRAFTPEEIVEIRKMIRFHTQNLSKSDQKIVDAGLKQNSLRGVRRFVGEVVGHKLAA